jgi:hypothetical protein
MPKGGRLRYIAAPAVMALKINVIDNNIYVFFSTLLLARILASGREIAVFNLILVRFLSK